MKVVCKGYKTCDYRHKCYHSTPHNIISEQFIRLDFFDCISKCETDHNKTICNCSAIYLRKEKLKKLNEDNNR